MKLLSYSDKSPAQEVANDVASIFQSRGVTPEEAINSHTEISQRLIVLRIKQNQFIYTFTEEDIKALQTIDRKIQESGIWYSDFVEYNLRQVPYITLYEDSPIPSGQARPYDIIHAWARDYTVRKRFFQYAPYRDINGQSDPFPGRTLVYRLASDFRHD